MLRKVSHNPTGSHFIYLPKPWYDLQLTTGWDGQTVEITNTSTLCIKPHPFITSPLIISKTPLRLPLGGGGTDLPEYYTKHNGAFWLSAAINHYVHIILKHRFEAESKFVYSETQYVTDPSQFAHPILRAVLTKYNLTEHIELISIGDLPARIGLGSSGTFTVGLLNTIHKYLNQNRTEQELAEEAYEIERLTLGRRIGKQDQYAASHGGIKLYTITKDGKVTSNPINIQPKEFEKWLLLFYVNQRQIPTWQAATEMTDNDRQKILQIGNESITALENGDFQQYGEFLDHHWKIKSKYQSAEFSSLIDHAKKHGAISGKLCGAGNGGCILLVCPPEKQLQMIEAMKNTNTTIQIPFNFEPFGSEVY